MPLPWEVQKSIHSRCTAVSGFSCFWDSGLTSRADFRHRSKVDETLSPSVTVSDLNGVFSNSSALKTLQEKITRNIAYELAPELVPKPQPSSQPLQVEGISNTRWSPQSDPSFGGYPGVYVPPMPERSGGFAGGLPSSGIRDPLFVGGVAGGGMFVGPDNAMFHGGVGPQLPFGVPPGARFDPYGPDIPDPLLGGGGRGRGRGSSGVPFGFPNPDHLKPPGF
jgi:hypothetical protein